MKILSLSQSILLVSLAIVGVGVSQESAQAQTSTLFDFDNTGLADGQVVTSQISGLSITNGSIGYTGGKVTGFYASSGNDAINQSRLSPGASFSGGFLTTQSFGSPQNLEIEFDELVSSVSFTVADLEVWGGGQVELLTASIFDAAGGLLGRQTLAGNGPGAGDGSGLLASFNVDGISRLVLDPALNNNANAGVGYAIDNLRVETAESVPEPASMLGLLAIGALSAGTLRKRQQLK